MLINMKTFGRLGNRLFLGAHLIAFAKKHGVQTLNLSFGEYAPLFPWMDGNAGFGFPWLATGNSRQASRQRILQLIREHLPWSTRFRYWGSTDFDFDHSDDESLLGPLRRGRNVYFRAWLFRGFDSVRTYRQEILEVFRPRPEVLSETSTFVGAARQGVDRLIGVHVRWEDYRGTEHFLDQADFLARMESVKALWPKDRVRFVLFSNEDLPPAGWGALDVVIPEAKSMMFDLTAMSLCDQLMGPPSTFSGWASFSGAIPLLTLRQNQPDISVEDFLVVHG